MDNDNFSCSVIEVTSFSGSTNNLYAKVNKLKPKTIIQSPVGSTLSSEGLESFRYFTLKDFKSFYFRMSWCQS